MEKHQLPTKAAPSPDPRFRRGVWYALIVLAVLWAWQEMISQIAVRAIPYSQFKALIAKKEVAEIAIKPDEITGRTKSIEGERPAAAKTPSAPYAAPPAGAMATEPFHFRTVRVEDQDLVKELQAAGVEYTGTRPSAVSELLLAWVLPIAVLIAFWTFVSRRATAAGEGILSIGKSHARLVADKETGVTFDDVAGCDEAKEELREIVDFLKTPERYQDLGARIPKGALLVGPPGTGKTLLARAVAGEAKVPFYSITGSDFVEMFVGVGAARVRDLFREAKDHAPCIIFIDELDAVGRQRGVHIGVVNDEREQTLNALLAEMDGFAPNTGVIMLSATNRPEVLDRALLRPGRFDRQIVVDSPDRDGREAILKVHARGKKLAADADLHRLAAGTAGFSGADLANVLNEAALLAGRRQATEITQRELDDAVEKVVAGPERKSRRLSEDDKQRVAFHEVGHALVAALSIHADAVQKISIVPRGRAALGYTLQLPAEDQFLVTRSELADRMRTMLGGRAAEEMMLSEISTGAENDLERATALARQMVAAYGMSERIGLVHCVQQQPAFGGSAGFQFQRDCSEATAREIDEEVKELLTRAYAEAKEILTQHRDQLLQVSAELRRRETLEGADFYKMIGKSAPRAKEAKPALPSPNPV